MLPTGASLPFRVTAQVSGFIRTVRNTVRLSATSLWGSQPAAGPICGSEAP